MGELICSTCNAKAEGKTFADADELIDHSKSAGRGIVCDGSVLCMTWNGKPIAEITMLVDTEKKPKPSPIDPGKVKQDAANQKAAEEKAKKEKEEAKNSPKDQETTAKNKPGE